MAMVRFRMTGPESGLDALMGALEGVDHVDRVEQVRDLMNDMRDDSSSADLSDDIGRSSARDVEVHAATSSATEDVLATIERLSAELGVAVEYVDDF
ncbi:MAG TPA: hypothetical protein VIZ64_08395 [Dokdonella sp.]|jgi:hypothetical protein